jgi:H+/Cl- antiporter ClcA
MEKEDIKQLLSAFGLFIGCAIAGSLYSKAMFWLLNQSNTLYNIIGAGMAVLIFLMVGILLYNVVKRLDQY